MRIARSYSRLGGLVAALLAVRLLLHAPEALAQVAGPDASGLDASLARAAGGLDAGSRDAAAPAMPDAGPARTPPQALFVPAVNWPESQPVPDSGRIEVLVVVELDGQARLEACEHPVAVCAALDAALALAEFAPARLAGEPIAARVQVRFALSRAPPAGAVDSDAVAPRPLATGLDAGVAPGATDSRQDASALGSAERDAARPETSEYGALARVERPKPLATALELEEIRELPGAMGDPFRAIEALPGVVPVMSGLPYVYVRGAPPSATAYFYDDIQMPALFHLALGPAVVHPAMVGGIDFYPGVAPARYGRKTGGVVAGKALLRDLKPGVHGEVELRLIDLQAYVATPVRKTGRLEIAGRFGYPGLLIKLFNSRSVVQYWDYQLRSVIPLSRDSEFMLIALGSFDLIGQRKNGHVQRDLELQFHRVEARLIKRARGLALGTALSAGFERSGIGQDVNVEALRLGPKLWLDLNLKGASLRFGADMLATVGKIIDEAARRAGSIQSGESIFSLTNNPIYRSAAGRNVIGAYAELNLPFQRDWVLEAGLRGDVWLTGGTSQRALEPRGLLRFHANDWLSLHAAFGLAYQPAVFLIPLPGVSDVALDRGLQRAIQSELGVRFELPWAFSLENKLFAHFYKDMLSVDAIDPRDFECKTDGGAGAPLPPTLGGEAGQLPEGVALPMLPEGVTPPTSLPGGVSCKERQGLGRISAYSYGGEWLLRRASSEPISGWLSYTLSKADGHANNGKALTPNFDVRHVANLVFQWRISKGWNVALRGMAQSGRFPLGAGTLTDPRERERLPPFFRGDLQVSHTWQKRWGALRVALDWLNFTFQREPLAWRCPGSAPQRQCKVQHVGFPITVPLLGVRATF